jgi:hypothetical protein
VSSQVSCQYAATEGFGLDTSLATSVADPDDGVTPEMTLPRARQAGLSWHKIGRELDLTAEGARRRYGPRVA